MIEGAFIIYIIVSMFIAADPPPLQFPSWDFWVFLILCLALAYRYYSTDHPVRR